MTSTTDYSLIPTRRATTPLRWFLSTGWRHLIGLFLILYAVFPIMYIISTSLIGSADIQNTSALFSNVTFDNYWALLDFSGETMARVTADTSGAAGMSYSDNPFDLWYVNTIVIGLTTSLGSVFLSALAAYAFSRLRFKGRRAGLLTLLLIQMYPSLLGLVGIYTILSAVGRVFPVLGLDSSLGLIMVYMGGSLGAGTYLMYGFFNTVPQEIDEAAKLDGATHTQIYYTIIMPLVAPILAVNVLLSYIGTTSDFVLASIVLTKPQSQTLAVGLQAFISDPYSKNWSLFTAGAVLAAIPIMGLFLYLQKHIISGLTGGAVKG
jgi:arabinogalactan oligomer/maltooligosaccharide transport system permease protein